MIGRGKNRAFELTQEDDRYILEEQIEIAYDQVGFSVLGLLLGSAGVAAIYYPTGIFLEVIVWFLTLSAALAYRLFLLHTYNRHRDDYPLERWKMHYGIAMLASAVILGSSALYIFRLDSFVHQFYIIFLLAGVGAVASGTLASLPALSIAFLGILLAPISFVMFFHDGILYQMMGFLVIVFFLLLVGVTTRIHLRIMETLHLKILYKKAADELYITDEYFETIFKEAPVGIFSYSTDLIILDSNAEMAALLRVDPKEMIGLNMKLSPDRSILHALSTILEGEKGSYDGPYTAMVNGQQLYIVLKTTPLQDASGETIGGVAIVEDVSERIKSEELMRYRANHDMLTNIPNRTLLMDRLEQALARYRRNGDLAALLFMDLDHFKCINDSMGHHVGDMLLVEMAKRLRGICRESDMVARFGGDEFVMLLSDLGSDPRHAASDAELVAERIHEVLSHPFDIGLTEPLTTSVSIGIAVVDHADQSAQDLLKFADSAMYQAKKEGRGIFCFYQEETNQWIKKRLLLENALRNSLKNGELEIFYQPIIEVKTKKIVGAEALLRWNHPQLGLMMPDEIIPIAEERGMIVSIGDWVMQEAFMQFRRWRDEHPSGKELTHIAINISAIQFRQKDFVEKAMRMIQNAQISPSMVEMELTESLFIDKIDSVIETMKHLRAVGINLSIDDFGTGYSSLSYLKRLPFATLKIDKSFVRDIMSDEDDALLIETILSIAQIFNLNVVAEGVEDIEQYEFLRQHNCDYYQGFLCSQPVPSKKFDSLLLENCKQINEVAAS